jgi:hypothetical protein
VGCFAMLKVALFLLVANRCLSVFKSLHLSSCRLHSFCTIDPFLCHIQFIGMHVWHSNASSLAQASWLGVEVWVPWKIRFHRDQFGNYLIARTCLLVWSSKNFCRLLDVLLLLAIDVCQLIALFLIAKKSFFFHCQW